MNNKKVCILFEKDEKGVYHYRSVEIQDSLDSSQEPLNDCNFVSLPENKFASMKKGQTTRILLDSVGDKENIALVLSDDLVQKIVEECNQKGYGDATYEIISKMLEHIVSKANSISLEEHGGMCAFSISYPKEKVMNDNSSSPHPTEVGEETNTIDMSKIDPLEVIETIKKKVVAQDRTVETVVNNIYNNQLMIDTKDEDLISTSKSSILLDGPTGTGKTFIVKEVAKALDLPLIVRSSTMFSAAGYKGVDLSDMLVALLEKTNGNLELAQRGIIVLDEFDKLGGRGDNELEMKKAVQQELLTYLSGAKFPVDYNGQTYEFDTSNITFICLGAFTDMRERKIKEEKEKIETVRVRMLAYGESQEDALKGVYEQLRDEHSYKEQLKAYREVIQEKGYQEPYNQLMRELEEEINRPGFRVSYTMSPSDYIEDGLLREIVGRFSLITSTQSLGKEDLIRILKESSVSPLLQLKVMAEKLYQKEIICGEEMIEKIAEEALKEDTGARALQTVINGIRDELLNDLINGKDSQVELTEDLLERVKDKQKRGVTK